ncbi:hypothetical protein L7F22_038400 [Adiantum nelumboides]|nr:hypothetical protein [Adiantum nelumboides]MCO5584472.1 hypothetical protein [Adiantum nelumboides]
MGMTGQHSGSCKSSLCFHNAYSSNTSYFIEIQGISPAKYPGDVRSETDAVAEELRAEALSAVVDRRDVPGRETPLHWAVRMGDVIAAEILDGIWGRLELAK